LDFGKAYDAGFRFAYIKASQYSSGRDTAFHELASQLRDAGFAIGAYHFCSHDSDPEQQMEHFYAASKGLGSNPGELPPMLDWEYCTPSKYQNHPQHCVDWLGRALEKADDLWYPNQSPRVPCVYTYPYYAKQHQPGLALQSTFGTGVPLCLASYTPGTVLANAEQIPSHQVPKPWLRATLCQHNGNDGRVPGIPGACDMQVALMSQGEWDEFLGIKKPPALETFDVK